MLDTKVQENREEGEDHRTAGTGGCVFRQLRSRRLSASHPILFVRESTHATAVPMLRGRTPVLYKVRLPGLGGPSSGDAEPRLRCRQRPHIEIA